MSVLEGSLFESKNKQQVREELWEPCFEIRNSRLSMRKRNKRPIRYLCFPGGKALFLRYLLEKDHINERSIIVGIEENRSLKGQIEELFQQELKLKKAIMVGDKKYQNIVKNHKQLNEKYPFDIINLDINGSYHSLSNRNQEAIYIIALQYLLIQQNINFKRYNYMENDFYLLITSNLEKTRLPEDIIIEKYGGDLTLYLKNEVLNQYRKLGNHIIEKYLENEVTGEREIFKVSIHSTVLRIINQCSQFFTIKLDYRPICYRNQGDTSKMVAMRFICEKIKSAPSTNGKLLESRNVNMNKSIDLVESTRFLPDPES